MKKILFALLLSLAFCSAAIAAGEDDWTVFGSTDNGDCSWGLKKDITPLGRGWYLVTVVQACSDKRGAVFTERVDTVNHRLYIDEYRSGNDRRLNLGMREIVPGSIAEGLEGAILDLSRKGSL